MTRLKIILSAIILLAAGPAQSAWAGPNDLAILMIDSDSYLIHKTIAEADFPPSLRVKAVVLRELDESRELADFVAGSRVIVVDVMSDHLSDYLERHDLLGGGRTVFALRGSRDDQRLADLGIIFNRELDEYFSNLDQANIENMIRRAANLGIDQSISYEPVKITPPSGLYHPQAPAVFTEVKDYLRWAANRPGFDPDRPWLGLMFFSSSTILGQSEALGELIGRLEAGGFNVLPAYGRDQVVIDSFFLDENRRSRVKAVLSFSLKFYSVINDKLRQSVTDLDVPIFNGINTYTQTVEEWRASPRGLNPMDVMRTLSTPEVSGVIEPTPLMGKREELGPEGQRIYRYELIPGQTERLIPRLHNWIKLSEMPNRDKRVAIVITTTARASKASGPAISTSSAVLRKS